MAKPAAGGTKKEKTLHQRTHAKGKGGKRKPGSPRDRSSQAASRTPIVGIGASAGGLEALEQFFRSLRADTGYAFVVVQHLSPDFPSMMDELLGRHSRMRISQITNSMEVEPNVIYLRPARQALLVRDGRLLLEDEDANTHFSLPIDGFLKSLAQDRGKDAIGIILSGTGSDGSAGAAFIRDSGGTVLDQREFAGVDGLQKGSQRWTKMLQAFQASAFDANNFTCPRGPAARHVCITASEYEHRAGFIERSRTRGTLIAERDLHLPAHQDVKARRARRPRKACGQHPSAAAQARPHRNQPPRTHRLHRSSVRHGPGTCVPPGRSRRRTWQSNSKRKTLLHGSDRSTSFWQSAQFG